MPLGDLGVLQLGEALEEHDEDDGAVGNRDARYVFGVKGMWEPGATNSTTRLPCKDRPTSNTRRTWDACTSGIRG